MKDGRIYEGGFIDGRQHGQGVLYLAEGKTKRGNWEYGILMKN